MKKLFLALSIVLASTAITVAQTKIGHINAAELVAMMPETKKADAELKAFAKSFEDQLTKMQTELQTKVASYQKDEPTLNEALKEVRMKELQDLDNRMQELNQSAQDKINQKKETLYTPILDKAEKAIKAAAAANGFSYVFDSSVGALLVMPPSDDMMPILKKALNIVDAPATAPKVGTPTPPKK
jgi:outer membrane protein